MKTGRDCRLGPPMIFAVALGLAAMALEARAAGDYDYITNNGAITITAYNGPGGAVSIPAQINGWPVRAIGEAAFWQKTTVTSASIPEGVTTIGVNAFALCSNLKSVAIPPTVTNLGGAAFYTTGLTNVVIPDSVAGIGGQLFEFCTGLRSVSFGTGLTELPGTTFRGCSSLGSVIVPANILKLGTETFSQCTGLTNVSLASGLKSVGPYTFHYCVSLPGVAIPDTVTNIGYAGLMHCTSLAAISLPASLRTLGDYAFLDCPALPSITIPASVTAIPDGAFYQCAALTNVSLPSGLASIGNNAFAGCSSLPGLAIPASVATIGQWAFLGDYALQSIAVAASNPYYSTVDGALYDKTLRSLLVCPPGKIGTFVLTNGVASIDNAAFYNCPHLDSVLLPASIDWIGWQSFGFCSNLTALYCMGSPPSTDTFSTFTNTESVVVYHLADVPGWFPIFDRRPTAIWYPTVQTSAPGLGITTNGFGFNVLWASGRNVVIEACTNLSSPAWLPLQTNTILNGSAWFADPDWARQPRQFYRPRAL